MGEDLEYTLRLKESDLRDKLIERINKAYPVMEHDEVIGYANLAIENMKRQRNGALERGLLLFCLDEVQNEINKAGDEGRGKYGAFIKTLKEISKGYDRDLLVLSGQLTKK